VDPSVAFRPLTEFGDKTPKGIGTSDVLGTKGDKSFIPLARRVCKVCIPCTQSVRHRLGQARDAAAGVGRFAQIVSRIEAASKTADKGAALDQHLAKVTDPAEQARQDALLRPLTEFGDQTPKGAETFRTPGPKGMETFQAPGPKGSGPASTPAGGGAGPRPAPGPNPFGTDLGRRSRAVAGPAVPGNLPGALRNKRAALSP
jgi:hypothetical protein